MTRLEDLLYSLLTVIIRYHDSQSGVKKLVIDSNYHLLGEKSREFAIKLYHDKGIDLEKKIDAIILECTEGYPGRRPFLYYLSHEIQFLKSFLLDRTNEFNEQEFKNFNNQVCQMLVDFKKLLNTTKSLTYKVTYSLIGNHLNSKSELFEENSCILFNESKPISQPSIALAGLMNDSYIGNRYCNSGLLLIEEVLDRLNIKEYHSENQVLIMGDSICKEFKEAIGAPEKEKKIISLGKMIKEQSLLNESLQMQLQEKDNLNESLRIELKKQEKIIISLNETIKNQALLNESLQKEIKEKEFLIDSLKLEAQERIELQSSKSELEKFLITAKEEIEKLKMELKKADEQSTQFKKPNIEELKKLYAKSHVFAPLLFRMTQHQKSLFQQNSNPSSGDESDDEDSNKQNML